MEFNKEEWMRYAEFELSIVDNEPEIKELYLKMVEMYVNFPHTEITLRSMPLTLDKLFKHQNLSWPTDHPNEWIHIGDGIFKNKRNPAIYSNDGGKTSITFPHPEDNYTNNNIQSATMPKIIKEKFDNL
jgi:hypothetical protein